MSPLPTIGTFGFRATCPLTCTVPFSSGFRTCASARTPAPALCTGTQPPLHIPLRVASSASGASPLVKLDVTEPPLMAVPQSSTTCTTIGVGQATGVVKPAPIECSTGSSLGGVQPVAAGLIEFPAVADVTSSRSTVCVLMSPKVSLID